MSTADAVENGSALLTRLVDVCFAVTRQESGAFRFAAEEAAPWACDEPVDLSDALVEVDRLLKQWREILRVIPSLECRPQLLEALDVDEIVVDRDRWGLLVAIDGRRTVRELVQRAGRPVIDVCHSLLELIEAGAVGVVDPAVAEPPAPPAAAPASAAAPAPEPVAPAPPAAAPSPASAPAPAAAPPAPAPAPPASPAPPARPATAETNGSGPTNAEPAAAEADRDPSDERERPAPAEEGAEAPDRGAFLRLFSGLRES